MRLEDLFAALNEANARYLLIGGLASILYGVPRTTVDVDIAISISAKNVEKTIAVMKELSLTSDTEDVEDIVSQGGITFSNDQEVDVLTSLPGGEEFEVLWKQRKKVKYHGIVVNVISKRDQIRLLKKAGRKQDLEDVRVLERL